VGDPDCGVFVRSSSVRDVPPRTLEADQDLIAARGVRNLQRKQVSNDIEVTVDTVISLDTADAIVDYGKEHDVSLIAMATHARSGISRLVLGSVAESVVRQSSIPTLLFPPSEPIKK
jgi:nucleotide-binding universal stress UspA family protein